MNIEILHRLRQNIMALKSETPSDSFGRCLAVLDDANTLLSVGTDGAVARVVHGWKEWALAKLRDDPEFEEIVGPSGVYVEGYLGFFAGALQSAWTDLEKASGEVVDHLGPGYGEFSPARDEHLKELIGMARLVAGMVAAHYVRHEMLPKGFKPAEGEHDREVVLFRPVLRAFAVKMERKLREHDPVRGPMSWRDAGTPGAEGPESEPTNLKATIAWAKSRLDDIELDLSNKDLPKAVDSAVSTANLVMIVADLITRAMPDAELPTESCDLGPPQPAVMTTM